MNLQAQTHDHSGALSLLQDCAECTPGQSLLIVSECVGMGSYDENAPRLVADAGRSIGMQVFQTQTKSQLLNEEEQKAFIDSVREYDHVIFFSRVGDQIRFTSNPHLPSSTMCYTLTDESLNSNFGTACHHGMGEIKQLIDNVFQSSRSVQVTCPLGTKLEGNPVWAIGEATEVSLKRFPLLVPQPVPALGMSGRVALSRFLIGTGSRYYEPYSLPLNTTVFAHLEGNEITRFEGEPSEVENIHKHYEHVSNIFSIEPMYVHSWHAGIHPGCEYTSQATDNLLRWSGTAFGNPRLLHFHTCGDYAPGEISWNILDPTITVDGVALWENGTLHPERLPGSKVLMKRHPNLTALFGNPSRSVGLDED